MTFKNHFRSSRNFRLALSTLLSTLLLFSNISAAEELSPVTFDASLRTRVEAVDWMHATATPSNSDYLFSHTKLQLGAKYTKDQFTAYVQGQHFQLYDLPSAPAAGPGGAYGLANDNERNPGAPSLRQLWVEYAPAFDESLLDLKGGRFLVSNGGEFPNKNKRIEALKKERIYNRVIGPFDFTGGRSFDGGQAKLSNKETGGVAIAAYRATQGGFATDLTEQMGKVSLATAALSPNLGEQRDAQLFAYYYGDSRDTVKTDNRSIDIRQLDSEALNIVTLGAQDVEVIPAGDAELHLIGWGAFQAGDWGEQHHGAGSFAIEGGAQWKDLFAKPMLRLGYDWSSGDSNPTDNKHGTFFQMLPTARQYAYTPFFDQMNMTDAFLQAQVTPTEGLNLTAELHFLSATNASDLLYAGGGAGLKEGPFGYTGTPLAGSHYIGCLPELTVSYDATPWLNTSLFFGYLARGSALDGPATTNDISYGFFEVTLKYL